jgi:hypothetical protein
VKRTWNKRQQIFKGIAHTTEHYDADLPLRQILLELKILIAGHKDVETSGLGSVKQRAVR